MSQVPAPPVLWVVAVRTAVRAAVAALAATALLTALASPAAALYRDDGDSTGAGLSVLETLAWFVGLPLLVIAVVVLLLYGRSSARGPRYRPGLGWWAAPVWFHGPDEGAPGGATAMTDNPTARGGASARW